jgi:hypothetical protein
MNKENSTSSSMHKITLIVDKSYSSSFFANYTKELFSRYFNVVFYDPDDAYNPDTCLCVVNPFDNATWHCQLRDQGVRIVYDCLWDFCRPFDDQSLFLINKNWFWYNESMWYKYLGYDSYRPKKTYKKLAFMPVRLRSPERDQVINALSAYLPNMIYSYVENGIYLPDDLPHDLEIRSSNFQRYFNPAWYDDTFFSVVVESSINLTAGATVKLTEKIFKPLAFYHPFVVYGQVGVLQRLHLLGFATFNNLFDESYDLCEDPLQRLTIIKNNVANFVPNKYDNNTIEKIEHNHNHFFNYELVENRIIQEIVYPILEFANV